MSKTDRESFTELVEVIEDAGFQVTDEQFKSDQFNDQFQARFWILSRRDTEDDDE